MKTRKRRWNYLWLVLVGGSIPGAFLLGHYFDISLAMIITYGVFASLAFGSIALWTYANRNADGSEWWQDDEASGWRGDW